VLGAEAGRMFSAYAQSEDGEKVVVGSEDWGFPGGELYVVYMESV